MIAYFDSSAIVPLVVSEERSAQSRRLWNEANRIASVRVAYVEVHAALAMASRIGQMTEAERQTTVARFSAIWGQVDVIEVNDSLTHRAAELAHSQQLRGYDAIHLAAADLVAESDMVFACWDNSLSKAAINLGLNATEPAL